MEDYDYYLLKFGNTEYSSAELEMTYYDLNFQLICSDNTRFKDNYL